MYRLRFTAIAKHQPRSQKVSCGQKKLSDLWKLPRKALLIQDVTEKKSKSERPFDVFIKRNTFIARLPGGIRIF